MPVARQQRRRAVFAAMLAIGFAACAGLVWLVLDLSTRAVHLDTRLYFDLSSSSGSAIASAIAGLCDPTPYAYLAAVPVVIALARRRPALALGALTITIGAVLSSEVLKSALGVSHPTAYGYGSYIRHSWPSGAVTAATALGCSLTLAVPSRLRPVVAALGIGFAVAVACSVVRLGWHYPSDAVGGVLVALTWATAVAAALSWHNCRRISSELRLLRVR